MAGSLLAITWLPTITCNDLIRWRVYFLHPGSEQLLTMSHMCSEQTKSSDSQRWATLFSVHTCSERVVSSDWRTFSASQKLLKRRPATLSPFFLYNQQGARWQHSHQGSSTFTYCLPSLNHIFIRKHHRELTWLTIGQFVLHYTFPFQSKRLQLYYSLLRALRV